MIDMRQGSVQDGGCQDGQFKGWRTVRRLAEIRRREYFAASWHGRVGQFQGLAHTEGFSRDTEGSFASSSCSSLGQKHRVVGWSV